MTRNAVYTGWFLDVYEEPKGGAVLWLLSEDGRRIQLRQPFPITFYAAGQPERLRELCCFLLSQPLPQPAALKLARAERRDLFCEQPITVLAVEVEQAASQPVLFRQAARHFPELTYYNADIPLALRYAAVHGVFPLARCQAVVDASSQVLEIQALDSPWDLDPEPPPLRVMSLEPDVDPFHARPAWLDIAIGRCSYRLPLEPERPLLVNLAAILNRHDPDLLLSSWGDTWLVPHLLALEQRWRIPLPFSRDSARKTAHRPERSYFSYGQIIYRGQQVHFFGRWHVDRCNAVLFSDYSLDGLQELARVTALPVQTAARVSPGSGISAMQVLTALRQEVLVPWHKQQAERPKSALELMRADQGGLVYQPLTGLHHDVAEIDFISMYPSIMARFNISPETVGAHGAGAQPVPEIGLCIDRERPGLIPQTLDPLLNKRLALKERLADLPAWDPRRRLYKARASAHKWLLVTCFGYLGYKNARFGRIEAHESVTAYGREALVRAKEAAEDLGCTVLHMYVDGLWVKRPGASKPADFQPLLEEIARRTGLPIALDGIYRWVAFLPSTRDERVPVANRFFGVFQDGSLKMRGIEARRHDTPAFIAAAQTAALEKLAKAPGRPEDHLPAIVAGLRRALAVLRRGEVSLEDLLVYQRLSRPPAEYRSPSPAGRAAAQLETAGKTMKPGQYVPLIFIRGEPGVWAWDLPEQLEPAAVDLPRYVELFLRAAATILQPLGLDDEAAQRWLLSGIPSRPLPLPLSPARPLRAADHSYQIAISPESAFCQAEAAGD
jgi:DNA polymerase II